MTKEHCDCHAKLLKTTNDLDRNFDGFKTLYHNDLNSLWAAIRGKISLTLFIAVIALFSGCFGAIYKSQQSSQKEIYVMSAKIFDKIANIDKRLSIMEVKK